MLLVSHPAISTRDTGHRFRNSWALYFFCVLPNNKNTTTPDSRQLLSHARAHIMPITLTHSVVVAVRSLTYCRDLLSTGRGPCVCVSWYAHCLSSWNVLSSVDILARSSSPPLPLSDTALLLTVSSSSSSGVIPCFLMDDDTRRSLCFRCSSVSRVCC